jgi:hypothetical protein
VNLVAGAYRGTDFFQNIGGPSGPGDDFPTSSYGLDSHVDAGLTDGPVAWAMAALHTIASLIWTATMFAIDMVVALFGWAFSMFLLDDRHGIISPVAQAAQNTHTQLLGTAWTACAICATGIWALVHIRNQATVYSALAVGGCMALVALAVINNPQSTFGYASRVVHEVSGGLLSGVTERSVGSPEAAQQAVVRHMREVWIVRPWMILEFGGTKHCVNTNHLDSDGFPQPVNPNSPAKTVCRDNTRYAHDYLASAPDSDDRNATYEAIKDGDTARGYDKADAPAVDIQQEAAAPSRVILALLVALAAAGVVLVVGGMALGMIVSQLVALVGLALAPFAFIAALGPPVTQDWFRTWGRMTLVALFISVIYAALLAATMQVSIALNGSVGALDLRLAIFLQAALYWSLFLKRKRISRSLGHRSERMVPVKYREKSAKTVMTVATAVSAPVGATAGWVTGRMGRNGQDAENGQDGQDGSNGNNGNNVPQHAGAAVGSASSGTAGPGSLSSLGSASQQTAGSPTAAGPVAPTEPPSYSPGVGDAGSVATGRSSTARAGTVGEQTTGPPPRRAQPSPSAPRAPGGSDDEAVRARLQVRRQRNRA